MWAFCLVDESGYRVVEKGGVITPAHIFKPITNNLTEFLALLLALEALPPGWSGTVCSDSQVTLGRFFNRWRLTNIPDGWVERCKAVVPQLGKLTIVRLDGHPTAEQLATGVGKRGGPVSIHNSWCDWRCNDEARKWLANRQRTDVL
jgi:ribonuclease HI